MNTEKYVNHSVRQLGINVLTKALADSMVVAKSGPDITLFKFSSDVVRNATKKDVTDIDIQVAIGRNIFNYLRSEKRYNVEKGEPSVDPDDVVEVFNSFNAGNISIIDSVGAKTFTYTFIFDKSGITILLVVDMGNSEITLSQTRNIHV